MSGNDDAGAVEVGPEEADELLKAGALLLDVRETSEWEAGHIADAVHIPLGELAERAAELPRDREIVAVCRVGGRSGRATAYLRESGYRVVNLAGGMQAWDAAGLPFSASDGSPGAVV